MSATYPICQPDLAAIVFENNLGGSFGNYTTAIYKASTGRVMAFTEFEKEFDAVKAAYLLLLSAQHSKKLLKMTHPLTLKI
jgi:hypothetical protein